MSSDDKEDVFRSTCSSVKQTNIVKATGNFRPTCKLNPAGKATMTASAPFSCATRTWWTTGIFPPGTQEKSDAATWVHDGPRGSQWRMAMNHLLPDLVKCWWFFFKPIWKIVKLVKSFPDFRSKWNTRPQNTTWIHVFSQKYETDFGQWFTSNKPAKSHSERIPQSSKPNISGWLSSVSWARVGFWTVSRR